MVDARIEPVGDTGIIVVLGDELSIETNQRVHALDQALHDMQIDGVLEIVPALASLMVAFDPEVVDHTNLIEQVAGTLSAEPEPSGGRRWRIPAHYGGASGPDLAEVADRMGVSESTAVDEHADTNHLVMMLGFAPGLSYLGLLPERWNLPRLDTIKPMVPAGSISVAIRQSVFCATPIPTGWWTIARSPFLTFRPHAPVPFLLRPGDVLTFEPITHRELESMTQLGDGFVVRPEPIE